MTQGRIETITTRIISTTFMVMALAVFKPFGLDAWQWQAYVHLVALGVIGFSICMVTDIILKYVVKMPRSFKRVLNTSSVVTYGSSSSTRRLWRWVSVSIATSC